MVRGTFPIPWLVAQVVAQQGFGYGRTDLEVDPKTHQWSTPVSTTLKHEVCSGATVPTVLSTLV